MNRFVVPLLPLLCSFALSLSSYAHADEAPRPLLHPLFSDGAVLQRDRVIPVWGFAKPGEQISLSLDGKTKVGARTDATGEWMARIGPVKAGTGHTLDVSGPSPDEKAGVKNIAFGDIWICSGQSNMQMNFGWGIQNGDEERKAANYPGIRYFMFPTSRRFVRKPSSTLNGELLLPMNSTTFPPLATSSGASCIRRQAFPLDSSMLHGALRRRHLG